MTENEDDEKVAILSVVFRGEKRVHRDGADEEWIGSYYRTWNGLSEALPCHLHVRRCDDAAVYCSGGCLGSLQEDTEEEMYSTTSHYCDCTEGQGPHVQYNGCLRTKKATNITFEANFGCTNDLMLKSSCTLNLNWNGMHDNVRENLFMHKLIGIYCKLFWSICITADLHIWYAKIQ